jgi:DNA-binding response OmpR family regulator
MKKILLIEDDQMIMSNTADYLKAEGYDVYTCNDVTVGTITAIRINPDLIISDVNLAGNSGLHICKTLKAIPATSDIPIIYITLKTQDIQYGMQLGADDFLPRPYSDQQMLNTIQKYI